VNPDLLNVEQPSGLPTDENEADLKQDREEHEQRRGDPNTRPQREHRPRPKKKTPTTDSTRMATYGSGRCRTTRAIHAAMSVPKSAIATKVIGSHFDP
jgi:hypothetical protein